MSAGKERRRGVWRVSARRRTAGAARRGGAPALRHQPLLQAGEHGRVTVTDQRIVTERRRRRFLQRRREHGEDRLRRGVQDRDVVRSRPLGLRRHRQRRATARQARSPRRAPVAPASVRAGRGEVLVRRRAGAALHDGWAAPEHGCGMEDEKPGVANAPRPAVGARIRRVSTFRTRLGLTLRNC